MKKKIMKLVVKSSMKVGLLRMKFKLFNYNLRNGIKKRFQQMILNINKLAGTSFSKAVVVEKEG